ERERPFKYRDLGSVAAVGRFRAICSWRSVRLSGFPAWVVWLTVHLAFLNSFANRFNALFGWTRSMLGRARSERVINVGRQGGDISAPERDPYEPIVLDEVEQHEEAGRVSHE